MRRRERTFPDVSAVSPLEYEPRRFSIGDSKKHGYSAFLFSVRRHISTLSLSIHLRILKSTIF